MGMVAADIMSAAHQAAVSEAKKTIDHEVRVYIPSVLEAATFVSRGKMSVRGTAELAAFRRRRCTRNRDITALSVSVEKAGRDHNDAIAELASSNAFLGKVAKCAGAARETFDLEAKDVRKLGEGSESPAN
eukprot:jgi/Undpi1/8027/HiC_scaffold_24.g10499.m1